MSRGYNRVVLLGNLAKDPDIRAPQSKQKVARLTLAVGKQWKDKQTGEAKSHTDFINVSAWGFTADICEKYLSKGKPVLIEGRISVRDYDDPKTGRHVWITEVMAENVTLLGGGQNTGQNAGGNDPQSRAETQSSADRNADKSADMGSLRDETGFEDEFPLDFSEMDSGKAPGEVQIPF
jgi:single-strand DNA-binding protein